MNCPVCQNDLNLPETSKETMELHYDCPSCFSSLFVKGGKCEVLSAGPASDKMQTDSPSVQETLPEAELSVDSERESENFMTEEQVESSMDSPSESLLTEDPGSTGLKEESPEEDSVSEVTEVPILEEIEEVSPVSNAPSSEANEPSSSISEEPPTSFEFSEEESSESEGPFVQPASEVEDENIAPEGEDFSDMEQFGNAPAPSGKGAFYYDVTVNDIDSPKLREKVEEILEDEALKLEPDQVHLSKPEGRLAINKISPVQTHVIVKSLLGLSLTISWNQHLIADTKLEEPQTESEPMEIDKT